jgi:hypothetical protein
MPHADESSKQTNKQNHTMKTVETFNFMSNLPYKIFSERVGFKSGSPSGFTESGYIAYLHDGINKKSQEVWGLERDIAITNLKTFLAK